MQPEGCWCRLQDLTVSTMKFSVMARNALIILTLDPAHSGPDEDGNSKTIQGHPKGQNMIRFLRRLTGDDLMMAPKATEDDSRSWSNKN